MKIIAYYLPQFHEIEENNLWWGKGFTEWTNLKKAKSLYKGHKQPSIPKNYNYYDLMDKKIVEWQTNLLNSYNIEGLCYYHYWFEGKKILEKPAENLLKWKDISQKFCFCWANHSWRKTWNGTNEMLIEQKYGEEEEWNNHINYLMEFFKDSRYIKIDNKPIFMIFDANSIPKLEERLNFYTQKCIENGFNGIYLIESINKIEQKTNEKVFTAATLREPNIGINALNFMKKLEYRIKRRISEKYIRVPAIFNSKDIYNSSLLKFKEYNSVTRFIVKSYNILIFFY